LGPESLPRSPAFRDDGDLQARLFTQVLDRTTGIAEGLQKRFAIKLVFVGGLLAETRKGELYIIS
jgi:hypothetical protein